MLPMLNGTLHIITLLISIARELYGTSNSIDDRVMHLEPIDTEYNLAPEVLAHTTSYQQLQRACSDWLKMFSKLNTASVLSVPTKAVADVLL